MKVFSISDLHLSGAADKPMDVFGAGWENHFEKIKSDWKKKVLSDEDIVLIAGDISWGTTLEEGLYDLNFLKDLPGKKVFYPRQSRLLVERYNQVAPRRARRKILLFTERLR